MHFKSSYHPYTETGAFSTWVEDYLKDDPLLRPFYQHRPDLKGILDAIEKRRIYKTDRNLLVQKFRAQYQYIPNKETAGINIDKLQNENCFTICAAHQPHLFTGPLYVVYKILHAIRLAEELSDQFPGLDFVPVYFMGSEDADLDELGVVKIQENLCRWETRQTGAFGRMEVDEDLLKLIDESSLSAGPYANDMTQLIRTHFVKGQTIQQCTFTFIHALFGKYGLLVFLPDDRDFKMLFRSTMERELFDEFSHKAVKETLSNLPEKYRAQTTGRAINLFYLKDNRRERMLKDQHGFAVNHTDIRFTAQEIQQELSLYPERFSPNVILRPVFQEMILPNVAFIGGGSELAYWMLLKKVFESVGVPYPVVFLRNSFLLIDINTGNLISKRSLTPIQLFYQSDDLIRASLIQLAGENISLSNEMKELDVWFDVVKHKSGDIDVTLKKHVEALHVKFNKLIEKLEHKMFRAEKKKQEIVVRQLQEIKSHTHPNGILQERIESFVNYYAQYGNSFLDDIYQHSKSIDQQFCILTERS